MICWIPKNTCTKFKQLVLRLEGSPDWENNSRIHSSNVDLRSNLQPNSLLNEIVASSSWKRLAILRDPLERFVSGYLDKVVQGCWFRDTIGRCYKANLQDFGQFLESDVWIDNDHFASQWRFCGFEEFPWIWNEVLLYHELSIREAAVEVLGTHVDTSILLSGWKGGEMFATRIGHETSGTNIKKRFLDEICSSTSIQSRLTTRLQSDYTFFHFPSSTLCSSHTKNTFHEI